MQSAKGLFGSMSFCSRRSSRLAIIFALESGRTGGTPPVPLRHADLLGGVLIAMWNYMGWDNLSTIAGEVEAPQRTYPRAMCGALLLVTLSYLLPVAAVSRTGINPSIWTTGAWVVIGQLIGGPTLAIRYCVSSESLVPSEPSAR